jgi:TRAP-type transport system periplasmic protein
VAHNLHFAGYQPARSVLTRALHVLREGAPAGVTISVTDNIAERGHKAADLLALVEAGELDGCYFASSYLAERVPALGVFDAPFQAGAREATFKALDGERGAGLAEQIAHTTGYRVLGFWDNGIRHISNAVRPIQSPTDCVGLKLRTMDNAQHQAAFRRLGFQPMFIDPAGLARAVAEGQVDAQENPLTNLVNFGVHEHHKFVSLTGHLLGIALLLINRARFDSLPTEMRAALADAAREATAHQRELAAAEDTACLKALADAGVSILGPEAIDLPAFRAAAMGFPGETHQTSHRL